MSRPGGSQDLPIPARYEQGAERASRASGLSLPIVAWQIEDESGWQPDVTSPAGAEGIAQFEPETWAQWGHGSAYNAADALRAYGAYSHYLLDQESGDVRNALAAYNAGPGNLTAGYGYADEILKQAGRANGGKNLPYDNPFAGATGLSEERIDQGVDFGGTGPVTAMGPGVVTYSGTGDTGWGPPSGPAPGGFISYRLTSGPAKGKQVYVAEGVQPEVTAGQTVRAGQEIGQLTGGGIETGWASGLGTQPLSQTREAGEISGAGPFPTLIGRNFDQLLVAVGVKPAPNIKDTPSGLLPTGFPVWTGYSGVGGGLGGQQPPPGHGGGLFGISGAIEDVVNAIAAPAAALHGIEEAVSWFTPSKILRTMCFFAGTVAVGYGVIALARPRVNLPTLGSTPVIPGGELGPALGIASVTVGAILLFFAFHNTSATDLGSFIGSLQMKAQHPTQAVA